MDAGVEIEGMDKLVRLLALGGAGARQALRQALYYEATIAFNESQMQVPVDQGMLRDSGQAYGIQVNQIGDALVVTLGYGGVAAPYALRVHEDLGARHNSPTKAKYLEDPVKMRLAGMGTRLTTAVDNALGRLA
jgi:hypothetical protein